MATTIRQKFIKLNEGKITKSQFLESARKDPQLKGVITPLQSFRDTVQVLKNKRIIQECDCEHNLDESTIDGDNPASLYQYQENVVSLLVNTGGLDWDEASDLVDQYSNLVMKGYDENQDALELTKTLSQLTTDIAQANTGFRLNEGVDKDQLKIDNLNINQIYTGTQIEFKNQKVKDKVKAREIAIKNLLKDPIYYTNQLADVKVKKKRTDLPTELDKKSSNTKDKPNEMKDAPEATKYTASANKANKDTQAIPKYKEDTFKAQRAKGIKGVFDMPGKEKKIKLSEVNNIGKLIAEAIKRIK